jgi:hypothetical protein
MLLLLSLSVVYCAPKWCLVTPAHIASHAGLPWTTRAISPVDRLRRRARTGTMGLAVRWLATSGTELTLACQDVPDSAVRCA